MTTAILEVPKWLPILRGIQLLLSVIVLGLSAYGVYWVAFNAFGFAIFTSLATIIIVLYNVLSTRLASLNKLYNHWAVLGLEIFAVIFWLSAMAALAALRAIFVIPTTISGCGHTGDIGGGYCYKRDLAKRQYIATHGYLNIISVSAGFSGLNLVLFIVTLVFTSMAIHRVRLGNKSSVADAEYGKESHDMAAVDQSAPPPPAAYGQPEQVKYQQPPPPANYHA